MYKSHLNSSFLWDLAKLNCCSFLFDFLSEIQYQRHKKNELKAPTLLKLVFPYEIFIGAALNLKTM